MRTPREKYEDLYPEARENGKFTYETYKRKIEAEIMKERLRTGLSSSKSRKIDLESKDMRWYR